ncbi:MAG: NADH dehydrogenase (quinone) [Rhodospirillaceae bacterium]|nr:MAG: NADH dehydrogenase (quinone) [Rhodospirillaceae bacterium]
MLYMILGTVLILFALGGAGLVMGQWSDRETVEGWIYAGSAAACGLNAALMVGFLVSGASGMEAAVPVGLPWLSARFRLDGLAAIFLLIVGTGGVLSALYGFAHRRHTQDPAWVAFFFPLFLGGMTLVPLADDAFSFLLSWELMSLASWFMVLASHQHHETRRAAIVYLVMAAIGTVAMMLAFGTLAGAAGGYSFEAMRGADISPWAGAMVVLFVLVGAGSKAGVVPLHAWLPLAHPAAPTHVSALMSGVMTKVALYAIIRVLFDLLPAVGWGWGLAMLAVGGLTAVLGVLYAVLQRDIKTVLAYSTVENIGVILTAIGLAVAFKASGYAALAGLSLVAGLFHAINHSLYKSLLFLGAGAVVSATGYRDLERLGGVIHRMPVTAATFLIGSAAIAALPPLNGFASEWLLFQALLNGPRLPEWALKLAVPVVGALLALATALASACFVRVFGITFLGRPRSPEAMMAKEAERGILVVLVVLAGACVILGVAPMMVLSIVSPVVETLMGAPPLADGGRGLLWMEPLAERDSSYSGLILLVAVMGMASLMFLVRRQASGRLSRSHAWDCGCPDPNPLTQYTASSFSQPIRRVFATTLFRAREDVEMPEPGDVSPARFTVSLYDPVWQWFYRPVTRVIGWVADKSDAAQLMSIREYLAIMFAALILLLTVMMVIR